MTHAATWDDVLDDIEHALELVEDTLSRGEPMPTLPPFEAPDVMPRMNELQRGRAEALMLRQQGVTQRVAAEIDSTRVDISDLRRRRTAARAYARGG